MEEFHADGFRYDEISTLLSLNQDTGWAFCRQLSGRLRGSWDRCLQNAEFLGQSSRRAAFRMVSSRSIGRPTKAAAALMLSSTMHCGLRCGMRLRLLPTDLSLPSVFRISRPTFIHPASTMAGEP